jgi:MinD superfamily P-loop ATPase
MSPVRQILLISGKGGTGKTSLAGAFALLMEHKVLADCDVDAANLHLLLGGRVVDRGTYVGSKEAVIDPQRCTHCGKCIEVCRFRAIQEAITVDSLLCEGCGACQTVCPAGAVVLQPRVSGEWRMEETPYGPLFTAELLPGEEASGKLVSFVKRRAVECAENEGRAALAVDGSPGTGCPVIASLSGVDLALLVTEPSLSGLHDLERILDVTRHFGISARIVINKWDLSPETTARIEAFARQERVEIEGKIPYDPAVPIALLEGRNAVEITDSPAGRAMREIVSRVLSEMADTGNESEGV